MLVSLDDFWLISEFLTKNYFVSLSEKCWVKKIVLEFDSKDGLFASFSFQNVYNDVQKLQCSIYFKFLNVCTTLNTSHDEEFITCIITIKTNFLNMTKEIEHPTGTALVKYFLP